MRQQSVLLGLAALPSALAWVEPNPLSPRQTGDSNPERPLEDRLCKPESDDNSVAPCINIEAIEVQCAPNGTEPIHLDAHAQCMCKGSFFAEKLGCERCLQVHGLRSERDYLQYADVLSVVSEELCSGTPTAVYASIFSWVQETHPEPTTGNTVTSTELATGSAMDVSAYYTASGLQGAGQIEGAAATAPGTGTSVAASTATTTTTTTEASTSTSNGTEEEEAEETGETEGTTTTDGSGAMPTAAAGGIAWGIAGAAILAAL
ncbi:hypothetical protein F5X68DRAFT_212397 [Plectosphaerella plurivora]|uniref:Uncharacterized protein n=1 Tax=Plectosphaerella plurivora TaxID=936078 RepID=A0A9P8V814_9PEZI|nr:hypothetical protein F5X68DRAFT_212397 [Plectosphaerella plurivora]